MFAIPVQLITNTVTGRSINNAKIAVTEINVDSPDNFNESNNKDSVLIGFSSRSFIGAQWLTAMHGQAMEAASGNTPWIRFFAQWSVKEGGNTNGLGFLSGSTTYKGKRRPSYYHTELLTKHFIGRFYRGTPTHSTVTSFGSAQTNYGCKILVVNMDTNATAGTMGCQINLMGNNTATTATHPLRINYNFTGDPTIWIPNPGGNITYLTPTNNPIPRGSTTMFVFDCYGNLVYRKDYTLDEARNNVGAFKLSQIGNTVVDENMIACTSVGGLSGTIATSAVYTNTTVNVTGDITLGNGVSLTFDSCTVVFAPNTRIYAPRSNTIILNRSVLIGCEGQTWKGIEMVGLYNGEKFDCDSTAFINAEYPVKLTKIPNILMNQTALANGLRAVELIEPKGFRITETLLAGFKSCIKTKSAVTKNQSYIQRNYFMDNDTSMYFDSSTHDSLYITCNRIEFRDFGIKTENSTVLKNQGTSSVGAGNRFIKISSLDQYNFINHGSAMTYYYDPIFASTYTNNPTNVTVAQSNTNETCPAVLLDTCDVWPEIQGVDEIAAKSKDDFNVFPNPSNGTFNLTSGHTSECELTVYDLMGRIILSRKVNFVKEKNVSFELKERGLYFATLRSPSGQSTRKIIVE